MSAPVSERTITSVLQTSILKYLEQVESEMSKYANNWLPWVIEKEVNESAGNICLQIIANFNALLLDHGYESIAVESEVQLKGISTIRLTHHLSELRWRLERFFNQQNDETIDALYPRLIEGQRVTKAEYLTHLLSKLNFQLGQISYHRKLI